MICAILISFHNQPDSNYSISRLHGEADVRETSNPFL